MHRDNNLQSQPFQVITTCCTGASYVKAITFTVDLQVHKRVPDPYIMMHSRSSEGLLRQLIPKPSNVPRLQGHIVAGFSSWLLALLLVSAIMQTQQGWKSIGGMFKRQRQMGLPIAHSTLPTSVLGIEESLPGSGQLQDMVFYGGHTVYPNCTVETVRILNLEGQPVSELLDWEMFKQKMSAVQAKMLIEVEVSSIVCGWDRCCTARLYMRSQSSDLEVFDQIYRQHHLKDLAMAAPVSSKYIIDAGANIGFSTMLLASLWPEATAVVALEPDEGNAEVLARNLAGNTWMAPVVLLRGGLWGWDSSLTIEATAVHGDWGYVTTQAAPSQEDDIFPGHSVSSIMLQHSMPHIDILKVDIEGAEAAVFNVSGGARVETWMPRVNLLALEAHPWFAQEYFQEIDLVNKVVSTIGNSTQADIPFALAVEDDTHYFKRVQILGSPCSRFSRRSMQEHCGG